MTNMRWFECSRLYREDYARFAPTNFYIPSDKHHPIVVVNGDGPGLFSLLRLVHPSAAFLAEGTSDFFLFLVIIDFLAREEYCPCCGEISNVTKYHLIDDSAFTTFHHVLLLRHLPFQVNNGFAPMVLNIFIPSAFKYLKRFTGTLARHYA